MGQMLERVVYVSKATTPDTALVTLADILATSDRNNRRDRLTGALLVTPNQFLQVLEGESQDLDRTLARLRADARHHDIEVLSREAVDSRRFGQWTMVAARITPSRLDTMQAIVDLSRADPDSAYGRIHALVETQLRAV